MVEVRVVERAAFCVVGRQVWIGGQDNAQFGRFWEQCRADGFLDDLHRLRAAAGLAAGPQTGGALLGVSRVEADPTRREFCYMIGVEMPVDVAIPAGMERCAIPAGRWAVFACRGDMPDALVAAEMYAFGTWLPVSGCRHALAPEMEVYPPTDEPYCEFWLPVEENHALINHV